MWIYITGNPIDGFTYVGPFSGPLAAVLAAETEAGDWWLVELQTPEA